MTPTDRAEAYRRSGAWDDSRLAELVARHARARPADIAVVDCNGARRFTYAELDRAAGRVATFLAERGVGAGDAVAIQLPNWYETVVVMLGALKAGAVVNPMLPIYREREIAHMLATCGTRVIFSPTRYRAVDYQALIDRARSRVPHEVTHVAVSDPSTDPEDFMRWVAAHADESGTRAVPASQVSEVLFTSGTEAEPKAVLHTEETTSFSVRAVWSALGMNGGDVVWMPSPIGHSTGFNFGVRLALHHGVKLVLTDRWDAAEAVGLIERERCSYTSAATTFLHDIVARAQASGADVSSMRMFRSGGAPVPPELVAAARAQGISVLRTYGSTECLSVTVNRLESPAEKVVGTDGLPLPGVEVEIRDDDGALERAGRPGEIFVRGPATSVGFLNDPTRTRATFEPTGWVRTGDLGTLDADGYLTIVGRKKEIIIRGGLNVAPRELEELITTMPEVAAVAVAGLPDSRLGEIACAFVVPRPGAVLDLPQLVAFLRASGLAPYKLPERLEIVSELPMTPTGKVRKHLLAAALESATRQDSAGGTT